MTYRSDKSDGPTAGSETVDALEFLARVLAHIPDTGQVTTRDYGWYANRPRGRRRRDAEREAAATDALSAVAVVVVPTRPLPVTEARRRWAELLRRIFEVDPLACPQCGGVMRVIAVIAVVTAREVIAEILTHLRTRAAAAGPRPRSPPSFRGKAPARSRARPAPIAARPPPDAPQSRLVRRRPPPALPCGALCLEWDPLILHQSD